MSHTYTEYYPAIQRLTKTTNVSLLIGKSGNGKSFLKNEMKRHFQDQGYEFLEGEGVLICGTPEHLKDCRKYLILLFLKHLAKILFKQYSYDAVHNPSEPMLLRHYYLEMKYMDFIEDTKFPKFDIEEIKKTIDDLNLVPKCTAFDGWWIREKFFTKLISPFEEEIENDLKKFFYYDS